MSSAYQKALDAGYSEEEINAYLSKKNPKYQQALDAGYSPEEISNYLASKKQPKESIGSNIGRQIGRSGARVAETVLGAPRAFGEFLEGIVPEKVLIKGAEKVGLGKGAKNLLEVTKKVQPYKLFPKSEDIRKNVTQGLFGEKFEPKNEWERKSDELVSDFAALVIPVEGEFKLLRSGLTALGGMLASEGVGAIGGNEKQKGYAKLGAILTGSLFNPKAAEKLKNELYSSARKARPAEATVSSEKLIKNVESFEKELMKGDPATGSKKKSLDLLNKIKSKSKQGQIEVEELETFKRDINEARSGLFDEFKTDKVGRKAAKRNLDTVSKLVDESLFEYGKKNPEWEAFYRPANEVHGAMAQSKRVSNWIGRNVKYLPHSAILSELGLLHFGGLGAAGTGLGAGALGFGAVKGGEIMAKVLKSPTLRKHYSNLIQGAIKEDIVVVRENLKKMNEELNKD